MPGLELKGERAAERLADAMGAFKATGIDKGGQAVGLVGQPETLRCSC
jgi:hypothetical protein